MPSNTVDSVFHLLALPPSAFVRASYHTLLDRPPNAAELKARMAVLRAGRGRRRLLMDVVDSLEFKARQERLLLEGDDEAFVTELYRLYLGRAPDPEGFATYVGALHQGENRIAIRRKIATSREMRVTGGFLFELELVIADERKARALIGRWLGRSARLERRRNQDFEIECRLLASEGSSRFGSQRLDSEGMASLAGVDPTNLPLDTQRVLSRFRHAGGIASRSSDGD